MTPSPDASSSSEESEVTDNLSSARRQFLAALSTGVSAAVAGCTDVVPDAGAESLSTEIIENNARRIAWSYPAREDDRDGIGYVGLQRRRSVPSDDDSSRMRFRLNSTVAELSTISSYNEYEPDWFRVRLWTPIDYQQEHGLVSFLIEPPGQWEGFSTRYEHRGTHRELILEMRDISTKGTILVPFVLDSETDPLPTAVESAFTVQASKPGLIGKTVRASDSGQLAFGSGT